MLDSRLIFLLSLPRSGSTMTQKILGAHSEIYTCSEPWLMLNPLSGLKREGIWASYDATLATDASQNFISNIPNGGEDFFYQMLRNCYSALYGAYLEKENKVRFLDKTPRYYNILPELNKVFPQAKYIVLYRNPLAVLISIIKTWVKPNYSSLLPYRNDLMNGMNILCQYTFENENIIKITYEDLLAYPEETIGSLCQFLALPYEQNMLNYDAVNEDKWALGDQGTVYSNTTSANLYKDKWINGLSDPDIWYVTSQYLDFLGKKRFEVFGYNFELNQKILRDNEPTSKSSRLDLFKLFFDLQSWPTGTSTKRGKKVTKGNVTEKLLNEAQSQEICIGQLVDEFNYLKCCMAKLSQENEELKKDYKKIIESYGLYRVLNILVSYLRRVKSIVTSIYERT